jgi:dTDP-glucose 4,6-dehydratase
VDNFISGLEKNLDHLIREPGFVFEQADITKQYRPRGHFDMVMNLASPASPRDYMAHPIETLQAGSTGTQNLLEVARGCQARFLLTSTSETYGDPLEHPQKETYWGNVNPVGPRSCYDESKRFAEALTMGYHRTYQVRTNIARIFNTFGPRMKLDDGRVVPQFIDQALRGRPLSIYGDGLQTRSFCYVGDLVDGLVRLSMSNERYPVNLGNPIELTILQFAEKIRELAGGSSEIEFHALPQDDPKRRKPDITKARTILGWEPQTPLDKGLRITIEHFRERVGVPAPLLG